MIDERGKGDGQCCGSRQFLQSYLELKNCRNQKEHVIPNGVRAVRNPSCL